MRTERSRPSPRPCSRRPVRIPRPPPERRAGARGGPRRRGDDRHPRPSPRLELRHRSPRHARRPRARGDDRRLAAPARSPAASVLVDAGDITQGNALAFVAARVARDPGRTPVIAAMNAMQLRRGGGRQSRLQLRRARTSSGTIRQARFPLLAANVRRADGRRARPGWTMVERAGREDRHRRRDDARLDGVGPRQPSRGAGRRRRHRAGGATRRGLGARRRRGRRRS